MVYEVIFVSDNSREFDLEPSLNDRQNTHITLPHIVFEQKRIEGEHFCSLCLIMCSIPNMYMGCSGVK